MVPARERRARPLRYILPLLLLAAAGAGTVALVLTRPSPEAAPIEPKHWPVRTVEARLTTFRPEIRHFGRLVATRTVQLEAAVAGRVIEVSPRLVPGGELSQGELLLRLDPLFYQTRLSQLEAELAKAEAVLGELRVELEAARQLATLASERLALAEREYERQKKLLARNVAAARTLEEAEAAVLQRREAAIDSERRKTSLEQRIAQQQAAIDNIQAQIVWAKRELADTELRAPFDAVVSEVMVVMGRELRANDPIARLFARDSIEISFSLSDAEFGRLWQDGLIGREVVAEWQLGQVSYELRGRVTRLADRVERDTAGIGVYAAIIDNPAGVPLRPDAFLEVRIPDLSYTDVFVLPRTAVYDGDTVYVVEDGRLVPRRIEAVARADGLVAVRGALAPGERVLATRVAEAGPGLAVRIVP